MGENNVNESTKMATGLIITLVIISVVVGIVTAVIIFMRQASNDMTDTMNNLNDLTVTSYENQVVVGSQVQSLLSSWKNKEICITVVTRTNTTAYNYTDTSLTTASTATIANATRKSDPAYINPSGSFLCEMEYDNNDVLVGVKFTQQ